MEHLAKHLARVYDLDIDSDDLKEIAKNPLFQDSMSEIMSEIYEEEENV